MDIARHGNWEFKFILKTEKLKTVMKTPTRPLLSRGRTVLRERRAWLPPAQTARLLSVTNLATGLPCLHTSGFEARHAVTEFTTFEKFFATFSLSSKPPSYISNKLEVTSHVAQISKAPCSSFVGKIWKRFSFPPWLRLPSPSRHS